MAATFSIQFYNISVPPNTLDKGEPTEGTATYQCNPLTWIDGLHATVTMNYASEIEGANYCKITADGRTLYCYKRDFSLGTAGRMSVSLELDPLMTNKAGILKCEGLLDTTTKQDGWTVNMAGDRLVYAYNVNKGGNGKASKIDYDSEENFVTFVGIYS